MYCHGIFLKIYIKNTFFDRRKKNFSMLIWVNDINIICSCLHDIAKRSEFCSVFEDNFQSLKISNIVFILAQLLCFFSRYPEIFSFVFLDVIYVVNAIEF